MHRYLDPLINFVHGDGLVILPQIELLLFALGILVFDFLLEEEETRYNAYLALAGVAASALGVFLQYRRYDSVYSSVTGAAPPLGFHNTAIIDSLSIFFSVLFLAALALVILLSMSDSAGGGERRGTYYSSLLLACIGMMFMSSGIDLLVLLFGLETAGFSLYLVARQERRTEPSRNATLRQFLAGIFGTGILLYGFSLLYGVSASTNIIQIGDLLDERARYVHAHAITDWMALAALVTVTAGMCFKLPVAPFHRWSPEVYESASTPVAAYLSVSGGTAALAMFLRLFISLFSESQPLWFYLIVTLALVSLAWGTLAALLETSLKRFLAYSALSQIGFMLLGLAAWNETGLRGLFYSFLAYVFMTAGAFAILVVLDTTHTTLARNDLDGLYRRNPAVAWLSLLFLASLAGIPGTAGSVAKYLIFKSLIESHHLVVAAAAAFFAILSAYSYFRVIRHAWRSAPAPGASEGSAMGTAELLALILTAFVTLAAGLYPWPFMHLVRYALGQ